MRRILSVVIWIFGAFLTFILYLAMLFFVIMLYPFDKMRKVAHAQCYWWSDILLYFSPYWKMNISGLENIDKKKTYVIVANHQSLADIIVLYQIKSQFKWVAKESLFGIPVLGWCMSLAKHIKLERGDFSSIKKVYREAAEWLRKDMSVLFFPEGTRSETGEVGQFQNGAFKLAIKEKRPVLPILIGGTRDAIPKGGRQFSAKIACTLRVFPAIETASLGPGDFDKLKDEVRSKIVEGLAQC
ncbi:MAG: lysophospholipid acyltransferase family protein [Candidatus Omnitrophota bacterium]|nr:lysophospholipid acyltransferase family protein [Candidatus Omnitrophota bacterium]